MQDHRGIETVGELIARVRIENGITQLRLADRLCASAGVSTVTRHEVSRWERAERIPTGYWLGWLALALEVPLDQLERAAAAARRCRKGRPTQFHTWREVALGVYERTAS